MVKLKRLKVNKYRRVRPGTELTFDDRTNVLLGRNGTGKTSLLDLISMIVRDDLSGIAQEEFDIEFDLERGTTHVTARIENARLGDDDVPGPDDVMRARFRPNAQIKAQHDRRSFVVKTEGNRSTCSPPNDDFRSLDLGPTESSFLFGVLFFLFDENAALGLPFCFRFDEALGVFDRFFRRGFARPSFWRRNGRMLVRRRGMLPDSFDDAVAARFDLDRGYLTWRPGPDSFLDRAIREFGYESGEIGFELLQKQTVGSGGEAFHFGDPRIRLTMADGTIITHDDLSYGQKRLLSFLAYLDANPDIVIADELVNGLHHRWIEICVKAIGERQAFLTSQNPLLFDYLSFTSPDDIASRFILCETQVRDDRQEMIWSKMSREKAVELYDAVDAGIEHVGEILETRGLW